MYKRQVLDGANKAMKAVPYTYTTPKWDYNPQTRRREKIGMEEDVYKRQDYRRRFNQCSTQIS